MLVAANSDACNGLDNICERRFGSQHGERSVSPSLLSLTLSHSLAMGVYRSSVLQGNRGKIHGSPQISSGLFSFFSYTDYITLLDDLVDQLATGYIGGITEKQNRPERERENSRYSMTMDDDDVIGIRN